MRLKNKKTGEIVEWFNNTDGVFPNSLAELNEEWEDYEETKEYWYIDPDANIEYTSKDDEYDDEAKQIGNYFNTREEAEQAVEKLKAWKRLKDNGYEFNGIGVNYDGYKIYLKCDIMKKEHYTPAQDHKDLDLLFGGEE